MPFVTIVVNNSVYFLSDIDGNFEIKVPYKVNNILFKNYLYRSVNLNNPGNTIIIDLYKNNLFSFAEYTDDKVLEIIDSVLSYKKFNSIKSYQYSYNSYNKFTVSANKNEKANLLLNKISKVIPLKTLDFEEDQHLLIVESVTQKKHINEANQKETILGARSSNVTIPSIFIEASKIHTFSIYNNYIKIGGKEFISPLIKHFKEKYFYELLEEFIIDNNKIYVVKFNPAVLTNTKLLKGVLFINSKNFAIQNFIISPAEDDKTEMKLLQSSTLQENNIWFPDRTKTFTISSSQTSDLKITAVGNSYIYQIKNPDQEMHKKEFDEIILEYNKFSENKDADFWKLNRKVDLNHRDSATFRYYATADRKGVLKKFLTLGENLTYGYLPISKVSIDLPRLLNFNDVEGTRIGFGLHTNDRFSDKSIIGGYFGYGFKDERLKYGADFAQKIGTIKNIWYKFSFSSDLTEPGGVYFSFDKFQYSSEVIRKFRLKILDITTEVENSILIHPIRYLDFNLGIKNSHSRQTYSYSYDNNSSNIFNFSEFKIGFRYAYGEQFHKFLSHKKSLGTLYPIVYFQFTKGLNNFFGDYTYNRYDFKIEQNVKVVSLGTTTFQLIGGYVNGNAPYQKLYNMRGSLKSPSIVIHNSFETMRYNEFLSDRYLSLFISHNFGKIQLFHPRVQPSIILLHNVGLGSLNNKSIHTQLPFTFKTMEKGYFESGTFADNIIVINLAGMHTGFGGGLFYRYGNYASLKASENVVWKFSVNFGI